LRWAGFQRVRRQVCKRIDRRRQALGLADITAYRGYLAAHPAEWHVLDGLCRITISRFYRDRAVFDRLRQDIMAGLACAARAAEGTLRCWSAGCASGEEPYSLALIWALELAPRFANLACAIIATDLDSALLRRAERGCYPRASLRELPAAWIDAAFHRQDRLYCLSEAVRAPVSFRHQDIRIAMPSGPFHLVLCRNLVFTYFDAALRRHMLARIAAVTAPGGVLVLGRGETLPEPADRFLPLDRALGLYRKTLDDTRCAIET